MEHLQEQAIRLQNYLEKKLDSKKGFVTTKQKQGNWKLMKLKNWVWSFIINGIKIFIQASSISWKWKIIAQRAT